MFNLNKIPKFMSMLDELEDLDKPITYYNLQHLDNPLSNRLTKQILDFCVDLGYLHKHEVEINGRFPIRYSKTVLWILLERYIDGNS